MSFIVNSLTNVNQQLEKGRPFFVDIVQQGIFATASLRTHEPQSFLCAKPIPASIDLTTYQMATLIKIEPEIMLVRLRVSIKIGCVLKRKVEALRNPHPLQRASAAA